MIEKRLSLAVIVAVAVQTGGVLLWAGAAGERLKHVEAGVANQTELGERLARVEVRLEQAGAQLGRIERKLDGAH